MHLLMAGVDSEAEFFCAHRSGLVFMFAAYCWLLMLIAYLDY
nr:hypothetical protein [uncultured Shewanella sp.]